MQNYTARKRREEEKEEEWGEEDNLSFALKHNDSLLLIAKRTGNFPKKILNYLEFRVEDKCSLAGKCIFT